MISDSQMDKFFSDRLRDYPSSVPENMWDRIMEKKKKDRMFWLFFFRLFTIAVLALGLTGGYFMLNQKRSPVNTKTDSTGMNQTPIIANTTKSNQLNTPTVRDQVKFATIDTVYKKTNQNSKIARNYFGDINRTRSNSSDQIKTSQTNASSHSASSRIENAPKNISTSGDSIVTKEKETANKKDSLNKKHIPAASTPDSSKSKEIKKPEQQNKQNNGKWYLDLYASPDYPIVATSEFDHSVSKLSYTVGIKINRALGKHFSVKTGIQYSQINIIGDDSLFAGATLHIKRLDLPVLIGYSLGKGDLKTTVNGGVIFNLNSAVRPDSAQKFFESNLGLSLYLGVNFERKINERLSLFGEPYYRYQLSSMTISSVSNVKFIDIVGISIGARYYFKK
jgi:hypothetical protein